MSARYDEYRSQPFEDIRRADKLLNTDTPTTDDVALASALCGLARTKMMGGGRA